MVQLGFLVSRVVKNSKPAGELDILKLEHQVAYSWEELPAWGKKFYDKHTCLLLLFNTSFDNPKLPPITNVILLFRFDIFSIS